MFAGSAAHTSHADLPFHKLHDRLNRIEADRDAKAQELRECKRSLREAQEQVSELRTVRDRLTSENEAIKLALNEAKNGSQINARTIIAEVSVARDVPIKAIMSSSRRHSIVLARHEAMYEVARRCPWLSLTEIGRTFDRDHTTVIHALTYWPSKANQLGIGVFPLGREVVE